MQSTRYIKIFFLLFFFSVLSFAQTKDSKTLFQSAPFIGLQYGVMNSSFSISEITRHGNFGVGTFNGIDGEMIVLDGKIYRVGYDGKVSQPPQSEKSPFVTVVFFHSDNVLQFTGASDYKKLTEFIDKNLPSKNLIYAIRVTGFFNTVKARSIAKQTKPYTNLTDVTKGESIFNFKNVKGTLVGFRFPGYLEGVNVPGYHFHFLSDDRKSGGHDLDFTAGSLKIEIEDVDNVQMEIPKNKDFLQGNFDNKKVTD